MINLGFPQKSLFLKNGFEELLALILEVKDEALVESLVCTMHVCGLVEGTALWRQRPLVFSGWGCYRHCVGTLVHLHGTHTHLQIIVFATTAMAMLHCTEANRSLQKFHVKHVMF